MLPKPIITTLSLARLDVGHRLGLDRQIPVGAAVLTARLEGPTVQFTLDSHVLRPSDTGNTLLAWLDQHLTTEGATIAGYRLREMTDLLDGLAGTEWSDALRALKGCGKQQVIDLSASAGDSPLRFEQACALSQILCAQTDPSRRFADWVRAETGQIELDVEVDVLAAFRLVLRRIAATSPVARNVASAISTQFVAWLDQAGHVAARLHLTDLRSLAD